MHEKTNTFGFRPGPTQTGLYKHRRWLDARIFRLRKKKNCTIRVATTKALISFAVTAKLICAFVFAYAKRWFSHAMSHFDLWSADPNDILIIDFCKYCDGLGLLRLVSGKPDFDWFDFSDKVRLLLI